MNTQLELNLEILWTEFADYGYGIEQKVEAIERINEIATTDDLPRLVEALKSERNDFWIRELLSQPICKVDDGSHLPELFDALEKNFEEGHDNDSFVGSLTGFAYERPDDCRKKLTELIHASDFKHKKHAEWLMEFCRPVRQ